MLELVASLVVDLSDQNLTVYNSNQEVVRVIPVSTGKASTRPRSSTARCIRSTAPPPCGGEHTSCMACRTPCASVPMRPSAFMPLPGRRTLVRLSGFPAATAASACPWPMHAGCSRTHPPARRSRSRPDQRTGRSPGDLPRGSRVPATQAPGPRLQPGAPPVASARPTASSPLWPVRVRRGYNSPMR